MELFKIEDQLAINFQVLFAEKVKKHRESVN